MILFVDRRALDLQEEAAAIPASPAVRVVEQVNRLRHHGGQRRFVRRPLVLGAGLASGKTAAGERRGLQAAPFERHVVTATPVPATLDTRPLLVLYPVAHPVPEAAESVT